MKFHSGLIFLLGAFFQPALSLIDIVSNAVNVGNSTGQFTSGVLGLDGPKVNFVNGTSYDWWYFDAVSSTTNASIVLIFYLATSGGFEFLGSDLAVHGNIFATFENGTTVIDLITAPAGNAGKALIVTNGEGSSGYFNGTGTSWVGSPLLDEYVVTYNSPSIDVYGTLTLKSVAPAHYPCGPVAPGANLEVSPNVGWANAVPDSNAVADFTVKGSSLKLTGYGYHDKNWGVVPFVDNVESWYWGHGRLGPYSLVWFDVIAADGKEYVSGYASLNGVIISTTCSGVKVRPTGKNSVYPPTLTTGVPGGYHIDLNLNNGKVLSVNITTQVVTVGLSLYQRATGTMVGGVVGSPVSLTGVALYEQFAFTA